MPAAAFYGCICSGHGCFPPRKNDSASTDVIIEGKGAVRKTDHWGIHECRGKHDGVVLGGSNTVFINGLPVARIGDQISCGSIIAEGSQTVIIG